MARVPTWTELRLDAINLDKFQKECYRGVHLLLDSALPELDRKILSVNGKQTEAQRPIKLDQQQIQHGPHHPQPDHSGNHYHHSHLQEQQTPQQQLDILFSRCEELHRMHQERQLEEQLRSVDRPLLEKQQQPRLLERKPLPKRQRILEQQRLLEYQQKRSPSPIPPPTTNSSNIDVDFVMHDPIFVPQYHEVNPELPRNVMPQNAGPLISERVSHAPEGVLKVSMLQRFNRPQNELTIYHNFEHLKPPTMPLSKYFERTRIFRHVAGRDMYLKKKTERRKQLANKLINSLERIRLSSHNSTNTFDKNIKKNTNHNRFRPPNQNDAPLNYKMSEYEMRRITQKNYRRLPEVKKRRLEEVNCRMKVQNHKKKLEYSRKLSENRRQGIIDYPLKSTDDNRSITSSRSDFSVDNYERAADPLRSDPYY